MMEIWELVLTALATVTACLLVPWVAADHVMIGALTVLVTARIVTAEEGLRGFGSSSVLTMGALHVIAEGIAQTGAPGHRRCSSTRGDGLWAPTCKRELLDRADSCVQKRQTRVGAYASYVRRALGFITRVEILHLTALQPCWTASWNASGGHGPRRMP